jgi:hypothetical protein
MRTYQKTTINAIALLLSLTMMSSLVGCEVGSDEGDEGGEGDAIEQPEGDEEGDDD